MEKIKLKSIAAYCGAAISADDDTVISGICKDTRFVQPGDLFVAIRGQKFDGHDFIPRAASLGAAAVLVEHLCEDCLVPQLVVENSIRALGEIACGYRSQFRPRLVGITGSVGKTSTKEMIASVLNTHFCTLKTDGNYNNDIGMPFTLLNLCKEHEAAVIEMGTNHFGEIKYLSEIAKPDLAVITSIADAHIEFLGSKEGVLRAKCEILDGMGKDAPLVCDGDNPYLWSLRGTLDRPIIFCGVDRKEADLVATPIEMTPDFSRFTVRGLDGEFVVNLGGTHHLRNALLAIAVGKHYGLTDDEIRNGLAAFSNLADRQSRVELGGVEIINDCYNANPASMQAALDVLAMGECKGRRIAVLGDMLELGDSAEKAHFEIGYTAAKKADELYCVGQFAKKLEEGARTGGMKAKKIHRFDVVSDLGFALKNDVRDGDVVLLKASNGMKLGDVLDVLKA